MANDNEAIITRMTDAELAEVQRLAAAEAMKRKPLGQLSENQFEAAKAEMFKNSK